MRKRIKVYSFTPDERVVSLSEERPKIETEKRKELTFKFEFDTQTKNFELAPLKEELIIAKAKEANGT